MSESFHLPHITHYRVLTSDNPAGMGPQVETAIHEGWQPFGSLTVAQDDNGSTFYAQPIVRYAEWFR